MFLLERTPYGIGPSVHCTPPGFPAVQSHLTNCLTQLQQRRTSRSGHASCSYQETKVDVKVRPARNSAELRSAASLRASSFYNHPVGRSEFAAQSHLRMKADAMWGQLEEAYSEAQHADREPSSGEPSHLQRVVCFLATVADKTDSAVAEAMRQEMDPSCTLPADPDTGEPQRLVVGTLDLNFGPRLASEELAGKLPEGSAALRGRAYLSNVSVARAARRQGIAAAMIVAARSYASRRGIRQIYVHAAVDNAAAIALYGRHCGFEVEQEENASFARALNRPKRILFRKTVLQVPV